MALLRTFLVFLFCSHLSAALPVIVSFTASSQTVSSGNRIILNCSVAGATTDIELDDGSGSFTATNSSCGGGIAKSPTRTTLYKLVASNNTGSDGQVWAHQRIFVGTGNLSAGVTNCSGATQNSASCVITVSVGGAYANRYTDMVCDVSFTSPSAARIRRTSYWDPLAAVWKISLRPTESGAYSWSGYCGANPSGGPNNYTAVSGSFTSTASTASGFLALYGGVAPYRLKTAGDGKPFYPIGIQEGFDYNSTNGTGLFLPMTLGGNGSDSAPGTIPGDTIYPATADQYFGAYRPAGTNIFRNDGESTSGIFAGQYCDGKGLSNFDHDIIVKLDNLVAKADFYGIKLQMVPYYDPGPNVLPGYDFFANLKASSCFLNLWLEYFARYGDQTSIWELGNEIVPGVQYVKTLVAFIHSQDPYNHLVTLPSIPGNNVGLDVTSPHYYFSDTTNPAATQTLDDTMVMGIINPMKSTFPNQPIIFGEIGDACPAPDADPPANERWRDMLWTAFFNQAGVIAWNSFHGDGTGCGGGLSNLFVGVTQRAQQFVFSNWISDFDPLATPTSVTLGNLGGNTARVYALAGSTSIGAYIIHANNHSSVVTGATATLNVPASGLVAIWMNPFDGTILRTSTPSAGSQTFNIPEFSQDIVLKIAAVSTTSGGQILPPSGVSFSAGPNPITPIAGTIVGKTTLTWNAPGFSALQIWVAGQLMASGLSTSGLADTGNWVSDGMVFSLVDSASGQTIATVMTHTNPPSSQVSVGTRNASGASLNIQQFGGKGDGVSDDAPAFRAAFAALANIGGGTLTVPDTGKPYLVGSWDPTPRDGLLFVALIPPNVTLTGTGVIKMKDDVYPTPTDGSGGVYYGLNLFGAFGSSNITVSYLSFDMNGQNNLQPSGLPHIMNTFRFYGVATNVIVQNVTISNSPGHNMIVFEASLGAGDGAIVKNSTFSVGGHGIPGNILNSDFSFLYSEWSHTQFLNNTIHQDPSNDHASGGIEIHGSHSVAIGNRIENCNPAFWLASTPIAVDDVVVSNNKIINANRGIAFWSGDNSLSNIQLTGNWISIHYNPVFTQLYGLGDDAAGIVTPYLYAATIGQYVSGTADGSVIRNLTITGNTISSSDGKLAVNTQPGIVIQGVQNALIAGNTISHMGSNGIVVFGSPWGDNNIVVDRNNLQDVGLNTTQFGHEGILVDTNGSSVVPVSSVFDAANIIIFGNTMTQTGTGIQTVGYSLNWAQGHMHNLVVGANGLNVVVGGPQMADGAMITRDPVETVGPLNVQSPCVTGDITWQVAKDVMSGWLCDAGTWTVFGR